MAGRHLVQSAVRFAREKFFIMPLIGAMSYVGSLGVFVMAYTSMKKSDVVFNRWAAKLPEDRVDWTRPTQKLLMTNSAEYAGYGVQNPHEKRLHEMIYESGDYR